MKSLVIALTILAIIALSIAIPPLLDSAKAQHDAEEIAQYIASDLAENMLRALLPLLAIPSNTTSLTLLHLLVPPVTIGIPSLIVLEPQNISIELSATIPRYIVYPGDIEGSKVAVSYRYTNTNETLLLEVINATSYRVVIKPLNATDSTRFLSATECVVHRRGMIAQICTRRMVVNHNISVYISRATLYDFDLLPIQISYRILVRGSEGSTASVEKLTVDYIDKTIEVSSLGQNLTLRGSCVVKLLNFVKVLRNRITSWATDRGISVSIDINTRIQCDAKALRLVFRGHALFSRIASGIYIAKSVKLTNRTIEMIIENTTYRALAPSVSISVTAKPRDRS